MISAILYLVIAAFGLYVLLPLLDKDLRSRRLERLSHEQEDLVLRKDRIVTSLTDLEFDFQMKKISEPDYLQVKDQLSRDYINVKKALEKPATNRPRHAA